MPRKRAQVLPPAGPKDKPASNRVCDTSRLLFVSYVGGNISRQEFTNRLTQAGTGPAARDRLLKSAAKLRILSVRS